MREDLATWELVTGPYARVFRAPLSPEPRLGLGQCALPLALAVEMFGPMLIALRVARDPNEARALAHRRPDRTMGVLEALFRAYPVMLWSTAPCGEWSMRAFEPVLTEGAAVRVHPLHGAYLGSESNDVHVARAVDATALPVRVLAARRLDACHAENTMPELDLPDDALLGFAIAADEAPKGEAAQGAPRRFASVAMLERAMEHGAVAIDDRVRVGADTSSAGQALARALAPDELRPQFSGWSPARFRPQEVRELVLQARWRRGAGYAATMRGLWSFGVCVAERSGFSLCIDDISVPSSTREMHKAVLECARKSASDPDAEFRTELEIRNRFIDDVATAYHGVDTRRRDELRRRRPTRVLEGIFGSFVRGWQGTEVSSAYVFGADRQPYGLPVRGSLAAGLSSHEVAMAAGSQRRIVVKATERAARARRLGELVARALGRVLVREDDCGTTRGRFVEDLGETESLCGLMALATVRLCGCVALRDVLDRDTNKRIVERGAHFENALLRRSVSPCIKSAFARAPLYCRTRHGVCARCMGTRTRVGDDVGAAAALAFEQASVTVGGYVPVYRGGANIGFTRPKVEPPIVALLPHEQQWAGTGKRLVLGAFDLPMLLGAVGAEAFAEHLAHTINELFRERADGAHEAYVDLVVRAMLSRVRVLDAGDTGLPLGALVDRDAVLDRNDEASARGERPAVFESVLSGLPDLARLRGYERGPIGPARAPSTA